MELHPLVTIIQSDEVERQLRLIKALRKISTGSVSGVSGLVEHQGLLVELDGTTKNKLSQFGTDKEVIAYIGSENDESVNKLLHAEISEIEKTIEISAVNLEELRADIDPSIKAKIFELRKQLSYADGDIDAPSEFTLAEKQLEAVRRAYNETQKIDQFGISFPPGVVELKTRWMEWNKQNDLCKQKHESQYNNIKDLTRLVEQAEADYNQAKKDAKPVLLSQEEEARLEILNDPESDPSRKGKWRNQLKEEEKTELQTLLDKVGVSSATSYSLFRLNPQPKAEQITKLNASKLELQSTKSKLDIANKEILADRELQDLDEIYSEIKREAIKYLGVMLPADVGGALDQLGEKFESEDWQEKVIKLRDVLSSNELNPPSDLLAHEILEWTDSWLRGQSSINSEPKKTVPIDVESILLEISVLEKKYLLHTRALTKLSLLEREYQKVKRQSDELKNSLSKYSTENSGNEIEILEEGIVETVSGILGDSGSSVPIAIVSQFSGLDSSQLKKLLASLEELSKHLQVIIITDRREAIAWAEEIGLQRASAVAERLRVGA